MTISRSHSPKIIARVLQFIDDHLEPVSPPYWDDGSQLSEENAAKLVAMIRRSIKKKEAKK